MKNTVSDFIGVIPLVIKTVSKEIAGLGDIYNADSLFNKEYLVSKKLSRENYRLVTLKESTSNNESSFVKKFEYNTNFQPSLITHGDEYLKLDYDPIGRLNNITDHTSNLNQITYDVGTRLPITYIDTETVKKVKYDSFLSKPTQIELNGAISANSYSTDGVLLKTSRRHCASCESTVVYSKKINLGNRSVEVRQFGRKHSYFFDGLGRVVQEYLPFNTPVFSGVSLFDSNDSELQLTFPNSQKILKTNMFNGQNKVESSTYYSNKTSKTYNKHCGKTFLNNIFQSEVCLTNDGNIVKHTSL